MAGKNMKQWWRSRTPEQKKRVKMIGLLVTVLLIATVSVLATQKNPGLKMAEQKTVESNTVFSTNLKNMSSRARQAQISRMNSEITRLTQIVAAQNNVSSTQLKQEESNLSAQMLAKIRRNHINIQGTSVNPQLSQQIAELQQQLSATEGEISQMRSQKTTTPVPLAAPSAPSVAAPLVVLDGGGQQGPQKNGAPSPGTPGSAAYGITPPAAPAKLASLQVSKKLGGNVVKVNSKNALYLPAGTIITGVTLNGVDAATGAGSSNNPEIVDIRVKKSAILPNGYRSSIKNCSIIASGYGSMVTKRVYLRTNMLSCVAANGGVISAPIKGYVVGGDGLVGVKGTEISYQGTIMLKSLLAGLLAGIGGAGQPNMVSPLQLNPGMTQQFQMPSPAYMGYSAASGGITTAAGQISRFYLQQAQAMQPSIQINPGISISIIFETGTKISLKGNTKEQIALTNAAVAKNMNGSSGAPSGSIEGNMPPLQMAGYPGTQSPYPQGQYAQGGPYAQGPYAQGGPYASPNYQQNQYPANTGAYPQ